MVASTPQEIWARYDAMEARLTAGVSERMITLAGLCEGQRVLDLATGRGEPLIRAAHRIGPTGRALGLDPSSSMLTMARERAAREGLHNVELRAADACTTTLPDEAPFAAVLCRWGLMFFAEPLRALHLARSALAPDGVLVLALWVEPARVPWFSLPRQLLSAYRDVPTVALSSPEPGIFRYASPERIREELAATGFVVEGEEEHDVPVLEVATVEELEAWFRAFGVGPLVDELPEASQRAWRRDLADAANARRASGMIRVGGVTRLVVARPVVAQPVVGQPVVAQPAAGGGTP